MRSRLPLAAVLTIAGLALTACDAENTAVASASEKLAAVAAGGANSPTLAFRERTYNDVISTVRSATSSDDSGVKAAANLLLARSELGLAELALGRAAAQAQEVDAALIEADAMHNAWWSTASKARRLTQYDPQQELDELRAALPEKRAQLAEARERAEARRGEAQALAVEAAELRQKSRYLQDEQSDLSMQAMRSDPVTRADLAKQEYDVTRQIAELETNAEILIAKADHIERELPSLELEINRLQGQLDLTSGAITDLEKRRDDAHISGERLRNAADELAAQIIAKVETAATTHNDAFLPEMQKSFDALDRAAGAISRVRSVDRVAASAIEADVRQAGATAHTLSNGQNERFLAVIQKLASSDPGLPGRDALIARLTEAEATLGESATETTDAYRAAIESLEALSGLDDRAEQSRTAAVADLYGVLGEEPPATNTGFDSTDTFDDGFNEPTEAAATGPTTPEDLIARLAETPTDTSLYLVPEDGPLREFFEISMQLSKAGLRVVESATNAFGEGVDLTALGVQSQDPLAALRDAEIVVEYEDDATALLFLADAPTDSPPVSVAVLTDNGWVVDFERATNTSIEAVGGNLEMVLSTRGMLSAMSNAFLDVADRTEAGEFATSQDFIAELQQTLQQIAVQAATRMAEENGG